MSVGTFEFPQCIRALIPRTHSYVRKIKYGYVSLKVTVRTVTLGGPHSLSFPCILSTSLQSGRDISCATIIVMPGNGETTNCVGHHTSRGANAQYDLKYA